MYGRCDLVIVCYGGLTGLDERTELEFVYNRQRLNTAVSRARKKTILLCHQAVLEYAWEHVEMN